jgi:hypothetical protein
MLIEEISSVCLEGLAARCLSHPMSWLAVTFTTQEINSLIHPETTIPHLDGVVVELG